MNNKTLSLALFTIIIWSSVFPAIKASMLGGYSPEHLILIRFLIASLVFMFYFALPVAHLQIPQKKDWLRIITLGFIGITIYHSGITFGTQYVPAGTTAMIIGSAPIFTTIIAAIVLKERIIAEKWIGLTIGFIGICLITVGTSGNTFGMSSGMFFIFMSVIATSIFFVFQKPLLVKYDPISLTAFFTWAGTIPMVVFTPGLWESLQGASTAAHLSAVYVGIFPAAVAYATWSIALAAGEASSVSSLLYLEPPLTILIAWIWLDEWPSTLAIIGGAIAISSLVAVHFIEKRKRRRAQEDFL